MDSVKKIRAALKDVPGQVSSDEQTQIRQHLRLEVPATCSLQQLGEEFEMAFQKQLTPEQKKQWLKEMRKSCARFRRLQKTEHGWMK